MFTTPRSCRTLMDWSQSHLLGYVQGTCHVPLPPTMTATLCTGSPCGPAAASRAGPVPTVPCARALSYQPIGTHSSASTCAVPCRPRAEPWPSTSARGARSWRRPPSRRIFFANGGEFTIGDYEKVMNKGSCLSLVSNVILYWDCQGDIIPAISVGQPSRMRRLRHWSSTAPLAS